MLEGRKTDPKEGSYTTYLFQKGIDKILKNWYSKGIKTLEDVQKEKQEFIDMKSHKKKAKSGTPQSEASYDLDAFRQQSLNEPLVYRKGK